MRPIKLRYIRHDDSDYEIMDIPAYLLTPTIVVQVDALDIIFRYFDNPISEGVNVVEESEAHLFQMMSGKHKFPASLNAEKLAHMTIKDLAEYLRKERL